MISKIQKSSLVIILAILTTSTINAQKAKEWKLDKSHASVNFSINHFFSAVTGKFSNFNGEFYLNTNTPSNSKINFSIDINSINTGNEKRDSHLQSEDFFNQKKYPKITFKSYKVEEKSDKKLLVYGKLTIKNITKDIILPMAIKGMIEHPMKKGTMVLGVAFDTKINRSDFNIGSGKWGETLIIGDEVSITIPIELNSKK